MLDGGEKAPLAWRFFFLCGVVGMVSGYMSVLVTQFFTDYTHRPVISIAQSSMTGECICMYRYFCTNIFDFDLPPHIL